MLKKSRSKGCATRRDKKDHWWRTFAKEFVSNPFRKSFWSEELKDGGCISTFLDGVDEADVLGAATSGAPDIPDTAIKIFAATQAAKYAASRALVSPLSSRTVQNILERGDTAAGAFGVGYLVMQEGWGIYRETSAAVNGTCH